MFLLLYLLTMIIKLSFFSHKDELFPHCKEINLEDIYLYYYGDVYDKR